MQAYKEWIDGISSLPWALASTALFLFAAWFSGRVVSSSGLGLDLRDKALRPIVHTGMGMLFLSMLSLVMSMAGLLGRHECRWLLCASGGVAFLFALSLLAKSSGFWLGSFRFIKRNWAFLAVFSFVALLYLGNALCVPAGLALDEQGYQLPVPYRWLFDRFPLVYEDIPYSGYPMQPNFLFALLMGSGGICAPRLLCLCVQLLGFAALYLLLRKNLRPFYALALSLVLLTSWERMIFSHETLVEPFTLLYFLCGLALIYEPFGPCGRNFHAKALALGFFGGALAAVKLTSTPAAALLGIGLAALLRGGLADRARTLLFFGIGSLLAFPYYLRVFLDAGNPFHPYFGSYFSSDPSYSSMSRYYHYMSGGELYGLPGFWNALLSPFRLGVFDTSYDVGWGPHFCLVFIAALFAALLAFRKRAAPPARRALFAGAGTLFLYIIWLCSSQQGRFLEPVAVLASLALAWLMKRLGRRWALAFAIVLTGLSAYSVWRMDGIVKYELKMWRLVERGLPPSKQLALAWAPDGLFDAYSALAEISKPGDEVMLVLERRVLFCPRKYVQATPLYQARFFTPPPKGDAAAVEATVLKTVMDSGAKYVLIRQNDFTQGRSGMVVPEIVPVLNAFAELANSGRLPILWHGRGHVILSVPKAEPPDDLTSSEAKR